MDLLAAERKVQVKLRSELVAEQKRFRIFEKGYDLLRSQLEKISVEEQTRSIGVQVNFKASAFSLTNTETNPIQTQAVPKTADLLKNAADESAEFEEPEVIAPVLKCENVNFSPSIVFISMCTLWKDIPKQCLH